MVWDLMFVWSVRIVLGYFLGDWFLDVCLLVKCIMWKWVWDDYVFLMDGKLLSDV